MAGRGTDIVLGGSLSADLAQLGEDARAEEIEAVKQLWQKRHDEVIAAGGLRIIGSERHESRRIDNQLRGRSGRQGDVGSSRFYLSLEDNLMRIFASERVASMMRRLGMKPGEPIEHSLVTKAIENAQRKLEGHHFDVRKQLLDYDNVANDQRQVIYTQRASIMEMTDTEEMLNMMREEVISNLVDTYIPPQSLEDQWDPKSLSDILADEFKLKAPVLEWIEEDHHIQPEQIKEKILDLAARKYDEKVKQAGRATMSQFEKSVVLQTLDNQWREHLAVMDQLRQGIHLRGYAQKDPKQEYKKEAFTLFTTMLDSLKYDVVRLVSSVEIQTEEDVNAVEEQRRAEQVSKMSLQHGNYADEHDEEASSSQTYRRQEKKLVEMILVRVAQVKNIKRVMEVWREYLSCRSSYCR